MSDVHSVTSAQIPTIRQNLEEIVGGHAAIAISVTALYVLITHASRTLSRGCRQKDLPAL